ncbi:hypothetical protein SMMN14_00147 [Sphaerulina musiva]
MASMRQKLERDQQRELDNFKQSQWRRKDNQWRLGAKRPAEGKEKERVPSSVAFLTYSLVAIGALGNRYIGIWSMLALQSIGLIMGLWLKDKLIYLVLEVNEWLYEGGSQRVVSPGKLELLARDVFWWMVRMLAWKNLRIPVQIAASFLGFASQLTWLCVVLVRPISSIIDAGARCITWIRGFFESVCKCSLNYTTPPELAETVQIPRVIHTTSSKRATVSSPTESESESSSGSFKKAKENTSSPPTRGAQGSRHDKSSAGAEQPGMAAPSPPLKLAETVQIPRVIHTTSSKRATVSSPTESESESSSGSFKKAKENTSSPPTRGAQGSRHDKSSAGAEQPGMAAPSPMQKDAGPRGDPSKVAPDGSKWKPYWSVNLDKPKRNTLDASSINRGGVPIAQPADQDTSSTAAPSVTPRNDTNPIDLGQIAMLNHWSAGVSDLCQACDDLWKYDENENRLLHVQKLQFLQREAIAVSDLNSRVDWAIAGHNENECIIGLCELDLLVSLHQLDELLLRNASSEGHLKILEEVKSIAKTLLKHLKKACEHPKSRRRAAMKPMTDGWILGKLQVMRREVTQLVERRQIITDSLYLLGRAYTTQRLSSELDKARMQLMSLVAQAKMISLGTDSFRVRREIRDIEAAVLTEIAAISQTILQADFTMSLNESAHELAKDMLQDTDMNGLSPATPTPIFGVARASERDIVTLRNGLARTATQVQHLSLLEGVDRAHAAELVKTEIDYLISSILTGLNYNEVSMRAVIDEFFDTAHAQLLTLRRTIFDLSETLPSDMDLGDDDAVPIESPIDSTIGPRPQWDAPPTPTTPGPVRKKPRIPDMAPAEKPVRHVHFAPRPQKRSALPPLSQTHKASALTLRVKDIEAGLTRIKAQLTDWVLERGDALKEAEVVVEEEELDPLAERDVPAQHAPTADELSRDLITVNTARQEVESLAYKMRLERRIIVQEGLDPEHLKPLTDIESDSEGILNFVVQCLEAIGMRLLTTPKDHTTLQDVRLRANLMCFIHIRKGGFHGRYNTIAQLEEAVDRTAIHIADINRKVCGEQIEHELFQTVTAMEELEFLRVGTNRMFEDPRFFSDTWKIDNIRRQVSDIAVETCKLWSLLDERRTHNWYLEGPSYAIADLRIWAERGKLPFPVDPGDRLSGARALLTSLKTVVEVHDELMIDERILGGEGAEQVLRGMYLDFDDKMMARDLRLTDPLGEEFLDVTLAYEMFLRQHLYSSGQRFGQESETYREQWREAQMVESWNTTRGLYVMLKWLQHSGQVPSTDFRLGIVTRNIDDAGFNAKATVEVLGTNPVDQDSTIIVWLYNDNAANLYPGVPSQWQGLSAMEEPSADAQAIVRSWFEGSTLPRFQPVQAHDNIQAANEDNPIDILHSRLGEVSRLWRTLNIHANGRQAIRAEIDKLDTWHLLLTDLLRDVQQHLSGNVGPDIDLGDLRDIEVRLNRFIDRIRGSNDLLSARFWGGPHRNGAEDGSSRGGRGGLGRERGEARARGGQNPLVGSQSRGDRGGRGRASDGIRARGGAHVVVAMVERKEKCEAQAANVKAEGELWVEIVGADVVNETATIALIVLQILEPSVALVLMVVVEVAEGALRVEVVAEVAEGALRVKVVAAEVVNETAIMALLVLQVSEPSVTLVLMVVVEVAEPVIITPVKRNLEELRIVRAATKAHEVEELRIVRAATKAHKIVEPVVRRRQQQQGSWNITTTIDHIASTITITTDDKITPSPSPPLPRFSTALFLFPPCRDF